MALNLNLDEATFDERWYLTKYPDVRRAVELGELHSGYQHFKEWGHSEAREYRFCANHSEGSLRLSNAAFRYSFYVAADRLEIPTIAGDATARTYVDIEFKTIELIYV